MPIKIREVKAVSILDIEGNIDINSSEIIETAGWLINSGKLYIILNFENVDLVDYSGLSVLAITYKNVTNHKGKLKFTHVPLSVIELFKMVRLDTVFEAYGDEESAINSFFADEVEKMQLRRKFKRLDMHLVVKYALAGAGKNSKYFQGNVLNISAAGVYIYTQYIMPVNNLLELEFTLPDSHMTLAATGKIVWHADKQLQPHAYPGMGAAFAHLTSDKEKSIVDFIDKNITYRSDQE